MTSGLNKNIIHVGVFGSFISETGLKNIKKYSYRSGGATFLDYVMNPFWELFARQIPEYISPNLLTILGFLCSLIAMVLTMVVCPTLDNAIPLNISLLISLLLFLYQTLDAADGKHARRLKLSSPLGQLLDHGLDSYTTIFFSTIFCACCKIGWGYKFFIFLSIVQFKMFSFIWLECHCKIFRCSSSDYLGVTESQFIVIFFTIYSSTGGLNILFKRLLFNVSTIDIIILSIIVTGIITLMNDIVLGLDGCKSLRTKKIASLEICGILCHLMFQFLFLSSNTYKKFPIITMLILTTSSSIIALRMNVSSFTLEELPYVHWPVLPFYISSVFLLFGKNISDKFFDFKIILLIVALWNIIYTIDYASIIINSICNHLSISLFSTKNLHNDRMEKNTSPNATDPSEFSHNRMEEISSKLKLSISRSFKKNHRN
ncbi:ethanolaminephosphotransferase (ETHPT) 9 transmembrane domain involved in lipid metabolism [Cryptosporidium sp. chipmunk genotype I]|uniref:ethanolaminephosphotransferase (ETHPT) 9 transmembrane domain involved in lipid metabolism n=1 Tax=Cryptosporidium sp. chipmunk genotype I TaxID=1280935 RepID=UPI00351A72C5|nr:ethanolaminephosphotransferase (ETHPT) 9 transmembrane domain involved in lipid metabolism [Cryptosporidium sp. chipmunk genotype I]